MALVPQNDVVQEVANRIASFSEKDRQPRLWADLSELPDGPFSDMSDAPARSDTFDWYYLHDDAKPNFFVSALPIRTTTGILRQHAMRLNSSVKCRHVPQSSFPNACSGARPFTTSISRPAMPQIRVCVPGEYGVYPWKLTHHRQDLAEELFLDFLDPGIPGDHYSYGPSKFTLHCHAETTRGYFELGNYRNNYTYGPLLSQWPGVAEMEMEFNDYLGWWSSRSVPSER